MPLGATVTGFKLLAMAFPPGIPRSFPPAEPRPRLPSAFGATGHALAAPPSADPPSLRRHLDPCRAHPAHRNLWPEMARTIMASSRAPVLVDFALQGGGAQGAFAWGVLEGLLEEAW